MLFLTDLLNLFFNSILGVLIQALVALFFGTTTTTG